MAEIWQRRLARRATVLRESNVLKLYIKRIGRHVARAV